MADTAYLEKLESSLERKEHELEKQEFPQFKDHLRTFQASVAGIHKMLLDKGLIKEDPYHYEQKTSELKVPSNDPFPETEKQTHISVRLAAYVEQLDFLVNFYSINASTVNLRTIKVILGLIEYVKWTDFSPNSSMTMTRYTAQLIDRLHQSDDPMASKVIQSSIMALRDRSTDIKKSLKKINDFHREYYKFNIRKKIMPLANVSDQDAGSNMTNALLKIKHAIEESGGAVEGFYRELAQEILDEDFTANGEDLKARVLAVLHVDDAVIHKKKEDPAIRQKKLLMICVTGLAVADPQIELLLSKMRDNSKLLENRRQSFGQKLAHWISQVFKSDKNFVEYEIEYRDPVTTLKKVETLNFTEFMKSLQSKWSLYRSLSDKSSVPYQKAENSAEEQVYDFVIKNVNDLKVVYKRVIGLDTYFKVNAADEDKNNVRGLKVEAATLKRIIGNLTRDLTEYTSYRDEIKQFKKLGIDTSAE
jgi:hypothetical protein